MIGLPETPGNPIANPPPAIKQGGAINKSQPFPDLWKKPFLAKRQIGPAASHHFLQRIRMFQGPFPFHARLRPRIGEAKPGKTEWRNNIEETQ